MIARRVGLAAMMIFTLLPIALSATGSRLVVVTGAVFVCLPLLLASALAWTGSRPGRQSTRRALREKRGVVSVCLLAVALVPVTWWPLRLAFVLSHPRVSYMEDAIMKKLAWQCQNCESPSNEDTRCIGWSDWMSESLNCQVGAFFMRSFTEGDDKSFEVDAFGGKAKLIQTSPKYSLPPIEFAISEPNNVPLSDKAILPDKVSLGDGWWFVSH